MKTPSIQEQIARLERAERKFGSDAKRVAKIKELVALYQHKLDTLPVNFIIQRTEH